MIELLSPAGEINSFKSAIENGTDAIYMGTSSYNARVMANNFSLEEYIDCIHYAHIRGVKVYLTLNTLLYDDEIEKAMKLLIKLYSHGLDAVIIQDIGLFKVIKEVLPDIDIHASTQMSVHNLKQVKYLKKLGFSRVVLAREMKIDEIEYIVKNSNIEIEVFVHGALCVSYSGQCLMSSMIGSRSGNRGSCAGPCRLRYTIKENGRVICDNKYLLSKKDIFGLNYISKLIDIGVTSLKIEGRGKTCEYVGLVTDKYRKMIDQKSIDEESRKELKQIFVRGSESSGYFDEVGSKNTISYDSAKNTGLKLGSIIDVKNNYIKIKLEENIDMHDGIEVYSDDNIVSTIVTCIKDEKFITVNSETLSGNIVWIGDISKKVKVGDLVYKTSSYKLNQRYIQKATKINRKNLVTATINILKNKDISLDIKLSNGKMINVSTNYIPEVSVNKKVDSDYVYSQFSKTTNSPFEFINLSYNIDDNLFVPISKLNELRREVIKKLEESYLINIDVTDCYNKLTDYINNHNELLDKIKKDNRYNKNTKNSLFVYKYNGNDFDKYISHSSDIIYLNISDVLKYELKNIDIISKFINKKEVYLYIPNIVLTKLDKYIDSNIERLVKRGVKGVLLGNIGYLDLVIDLKSKCDIIVVADYSLNIVNTYSTMLYKKEGVDKVTISPEVYEEEIQNIANLTDVETIENFVTVMTTRFCPVKSYSKGCNCNINSYELKDNFNNVDYNIVCDNVDCTIKLVRNVSSLENNKFSKRKCVI